MTTATQEYAVGHPPDVDPRLLALGFSGVVMSLSITSLLIVTGGRTGEGKSSFWQSCPYAYIINADLSSTSGGGNKPLARMWPGVRRDKRAVEPNPAFPLDPEKGIPIDMTWEKIRERKQMLIQLAKDDVPGRPLIVVLDTVAGAERMAKDYVARCYGKESFDDVHGKLAWPALYEEFKSFAFDLQQAGYGVSLNIHIGNKTVHLDDGGKKLYLEDVPLIADNLYNELFNKADLVMCVEREKVKKTVPRPQIDPVTKKPRMAADGKTPLMAPTTIEESVYYLTLESDKMRRITKQREGLPARIVIPKINQWKALEAAWDAATKPA
jgi:hypothetical protein